MRWSEVAKQYLELFQQVREEREHHPKPMAQGRSLRQRGADLAEIKLDHLITLTDDMGLFHHAKSTVPDREARLSHRRQRRARSSPCSWPRII